LEEETEAAEAKTATLQSRASVASLEEMEEEMRSRKGTFSGEGELLNLEDEPTVEGFIQMKGSFFKSVQNTILSIILLQVVIETAGSNAGLLSTMTPSSFSGTNKYTIK